MAFDEVRSGAGLLANGEDAVATAPALALNFWRYRACDTPVEIITGDRDLVVNPRLHAKPLSRLLRNANVTRVSGRGHMLHHFDAELVVQVARSMSGNT